MMPPLPGTDPRRIPWSVVAAAASASLSFGLATGPFAGITGLASLLLAASSWSAAADPRSAFLRTWAIFGTAHAIGFRWVIRHPDPGPAAAGLLAIVLIPLLVSAAWSLAFRLTRRATAIGRGFGLAGVSCLAEAVLHEGPLPLPWGLPSHLLASFDPLDGISALGGWWAPAAVVSAAGVVLFLGSVRVRILAALVVAASMGIPLTEVPASARELRIALVQPGMHPRAWEQDTLRMNALFHLTDSLLESTTSRPDWILWPETALRTGDTVDQAAAFSASRQVTLIAGALETDPDGRRRNTVRVFGPGGTDVVTKRRLVPWVEWMPLENLVKTLTGDTSPASSYRSGHETPILSVGPNRLGIVVCFESLFPGHAALAARGGARALVAVTNDSWWETEDPARAHLAFSRRRAVETGIPLVQASVSGFTGVIRPDGSIMKAADWMERAAAIVPITAPESPRSGGIPVLAASLLLIVAASLPGGRNRERLPGVDAAP